MRIVLRIFFYCCSILICQAANQPTHKFYVLGDSLSQHEFTVDGKASAGLERHVPSWKVYAPSFLYYGTGGDASVEIKMASKSIVTKKCVPGSYVINLDSSQLVSFSEIAYGRSVQVPSKSLKPSPVGIYQIDASVSLLVFDFEQDPPDSIRAKSSLKNRSFIKLKAIPAN